MNAELKNIAPLVAAVQLESVRLVESTVETKVRSAKETGDIDIKFDMSAKATPLVDGTFYVLAKADLNIVQRKDKKLAVSVQIAYELKYNLPPDFKANKKDLNKFAQINGIFNVWPYWREYIQSVFERMNLPSIVLPVYRLNTPSTLGAIPSEKKASSTRGQIPAPAKPPIG